MNKHLTDGQLRAALDRELSQEDQLHLDGCAQCQRSLESVRSAVQQASRGLAFLVPAGSERVPAAGPALAHFHQQTLLKKETSMFQKIFASRALRFASAVVVILAVAMAVPATRAMASQLLSLFRVQHVTVVPLDLTGMQQLTGNNIYGKQIGQLISSSTTVTQKPGEPVAVTSAAQASQVTGFGVRLPAGMTPAEMYVEGGAAFSFKVDRARAQALLDEAGRKDLVLPASIDGADIAVKIPASLSVGYGSCPKPSGDEPGVAMDMNGAVRSQYT
ncbi:MAG TPA: hypothetical protein VF813_12420, partial [Anaerolineaceae bacterium]